MLQSFFSYALEDMAFNGGVYALFVIPAFVLFWWLLRKRVWHLRIQSRQQARLRHFVHDIGYSLSTLLVFAVIDFGIVLLEQRGYTQLYYRVEQYGLAWFWLSIPLMMVLHDAYFYWAHRLMHHPRLYPYFHKVHHESTDPSPFTSFAFHPLEAVAENGIAVIFALVLPINFTALIIWQVLQQFFNMIGHLGFEVYPAWWHRAPALRWKTPSTHHNMHHERFDGNYGLYFRWWDRWMGTEFPDYEQRFTDIFARRAANATEAAPQPAAAPTGVQVTVRVGEETFRFGVEADKPLLQQALDQGIALPHACKRGRCGTCKMQLTEGRISMKIHPALTDAEVREGYVLTCQSLCETETISLAKP